MALDGIEGGALDKIRVNPQEIKRIKPEVPDPKNEQLKDPGRFQKKFENPSIEASHLQPRNIRDSVELNSRPRETQENRDSQENREPQRVQQRVNQATNEGLSSVNGGATRRQVEVNSDKNVFDQAAHLNEVAQREDEFKDVQGRLRETEQGRNLSQTELTRARITQEENHVVQETLENDSGRDKIAEEVRRDDEERDIQRQENRDTNAPSTDPVRNLDLLA